MNNLLLDALAGSLSSCEQLNRTMVGSGLCLLLLLLLQLQVQLQLQCSRSCMHFLHAARH